jgi:hypothetical protein
MKSQTLIAAALAAVLSPAPLAVAKAPAPLVPIALVEDVKSATADVEFMDYVGTGQVIKLAPRDVLVLSYLKSCQHETITGGTVSIGSERSEVEGGKVVRTKVACDGGRMRLATQQANASAASSFRLQSAAVEPVLYGLTPVIQLPKLAAGDARTLVIERTDKKEKPVEIVLGDEVAGGSFVDLAKAKVKPLARGGVYSVSIGARKQPFSIDAKAKSGNTPVVSRLVRLPPG